MNQRIVRAVMLGALAVSAIAPPAFAQLSANLGALTSTNVKGYLGPLPKALSATMNAAVFQSGNVPVMGLNFTVGVHLMGVSFSDDDRTYTPTDPPGFTSTSSVKAPTFAGTELAVQQDGAAGTTLYHPGGLGIDNFAIAVPQLEIGSIMGTRAVVRWIDLDLGDSDFGKIKLLGGGLQHSLSQHLAEGFPIDLSAGVFYQELKISDDLLDAKSLHFDVTGSKKFSVLEPYVGVGYDQLKLDVKYTSTTSSPSQDISVAFDKQSNAHLTAGLQANLLFIKLHGEVNVGAETGAAVGLRFGK